MLFHVQKPVTAAAVMTVVEKGLLSLSDTVDNVSSGVSGSEGVKGRRACAGAAEGDDPAFVEYDSRCDIFRMPVFRRELICRI